jgi:hypothetical protein
MYMYHITVVLWLRITLSLCQLSKFLALVNLAHSVTFFHMRVGRSSLTTGPLKTYRLSETACRGCSTKSSHGALPVSSGYRIVDLQRVDNRMHACIGITSACQRKSYGMRR